MNFPNALAQSFESLLATAFPSQCVGCGEIVENSTFSSLCVRCVPRLLKIESPKCLTCGFPFFGEAESKSHCMHCEHLRAEFGQGCSLALFRGPLRELIYALKYQKGLWALRDIRSLAEASSEVAGYVSDAVLVPVPLHSRRLRERGYNQSELIAKELAGLFRDSRVEMLLDRRIDTVSQTRFDRRERIRNLKNAFSLRQNRAIEPAQRYIIVDDVFTTGSTVNACAAALRRAGARRVDVLTVGHG